MFFLVYESILTKYKKIIISSQDIAFLVFYTHQGWQIQKNVRETEYLQTDDNMKWKKQKFLGYFLQRKIEKNICILYKGPNISLFTIDELIHSTQ